MIIQSAIEFIRDQINNYLQVKLGAIDAVVIDNVITQAGELNAPEICLSLINIEEEKVHKAQHPYQTNSDGSVSLVNPEIKLNLYLLVSANFGANNYEQALLYLSHIITFFQGKQIFNHQNSPTLSEDIEKLIFDLYNIPFEHQSYVWGCIGAKYMPSAIYRVRMLSITDDNQLQEIEPVTTINRNYSRS